MSSPLCFGSGLTRYPVCRPAELSILRAESKKGSLRHKARSTRGRVVIVILKHVTKGSEYLLITISITMTYNLHARSVQVDSSGKSGNPNMAIITLLPGKSGGIKIPSDLRSALVVIKTTNIKSTVTTIRDLSPAISLIKIQLTIRASDYGMSGMVMITSDKTG